MIDLNELSNTIVERIAAELRKVAEPIPSAITGASEEAPGQRNEEGRETAAPPRGENDWAQQLSALRSDIRQLNITVALLRGDQAEIRDLLKELPEQLSHRDNAAPAKQPGPPCTAAGSFLRGFGLATILSPAIFGLWHLAAQGISRLAGICGFSPSIACGALLCAAAGSLLLCLAGSCAALMQRLKAQLWPDDCLEDELELFLHSDPPKKGRKP